MIRAVTKTFLLYLLMTSFGAHAAPKRLAFTFDDAPMGDTPFFRHEERAEVLTRELKRAGIPQAMIFANPCKLARSTTVTVIRCMACSAVSVSRSAIWAW